MKNTSLVFLAVTVASIGGCNDGSPRQDKGLSMPGRGSAVAMPAISPQSMEMTSGAAKAFAGTSDVAASPAAPEAPDLAKTGNQASEQDALTGSMLIRTGSAQVEVAKVDEGMARVREIAKRAGGYIANSSATGGRNEVKSATLEVKIPAARFDEVTSGLAGIGNVESLNVTAEDVGEEYADLAAREANQKRLEERLVDLLAKQTGKLEEVLAVERELSRVREAIERMEGRMRYLRTRAAVSTLTVTVHEKVPVIGTSGENPIKMALRQAWRNFIGLLTSTIAAAGALVPIGILVFIAWKFFRRAWRRKNEQD